MPWLASLWQRLRSLVDSRKATQEEVQVLHLIEFAASRFGEPLLRASSLEDLDDRLDALVGSPEALHWTALLAQHIPLFRASEPLSASILADAMRDSLGEAQGRTIAQSQQILDAWLDAQRQAVALLPPDEPLDARRIFEFSLASPEIPADVAELTYHSLKAGLCSFAIAHVIAAGDAIEPWLAKALTDRLVASARQHLRLLASLPGITVDEAIVPRSERLDLEALEARHLRARAAARRSLEAARTRLGL
jgi:hypothetical protein